MEHCGGRNVVKIEDNNHKVKGGLVDEQLVILLYNKIKIFTKKIGGIII